MKEFFKQLLLKLALRKLSGEKVGKKEIKDQLELDALEKVSEKIEKESSKNA